MSRCCVERCPNTNEDKIYFPFPASKTLLRKWLDVTPTKGRITIDSVICHQHFKEDEYDFIRGKTRLKAKVVPSVFDLRKSPSPQREATQNIVDINDEIPAATIDKNTLKTVSTIDKNIETENSKHHEPNGDVIERLVANSSQDNEAHKDIEDIITNYQIKQIRPINRETETEKEGEVEKEGEERREKEIQNEENDVVTIEDAAPVYIEVNVDKGSDVVGDCMMVLESVQCEVDPGLFEEQDNDHDLDRDSDVIDLGERKEDPISLLTSSDEDEVVIEEPHIDTVEVSDGDSEHDLEEEDDLPLVKLVPHGHRNRKWPLYQYYCVECGFTTDDRTEYKKHRSDHTTVLEVCQVCGYTTASKAQFGRHKRKHKDEKKYKCHLCDYRARHNMSLIYHLKSHERVIVNGKDGYQCSKCSYRSNVKSSLVRHVRMCGGRFACEGCDYKTKRESDLRKHRLRRHAASRRIHK
ncbi:zinc finger protein 358-like isoform X1 [Danaus plexippus]|uniref:zinc finger protein 358-like isoform X1 n=1 Tax=Danaus plexippus TaxID=13037 RepID=UPI002AB264AC|nr:zinc finger protein 358-like isoform X1 [Danaus plexippus]